MFWFDKVGSRTRTMSEMMDRLGLDHGGVCAEAVGTRLDLRNPNLPALQRGTSMPRLAFAAEENGGHSASVLP